MTPTIDGDRLRAEIAELLAEDLSGIAAEENLLEIGIDSVRLMMLTQRLQDAGADVQFADLAEEPTLQAWERLLACSPAAAPDSTDRDGFAVVRVEQVSPRVVRVTLGGSGVARFAVARPGDRALVGPPGGAPTLALPVRHHAASAELDLDLPVDGDDLLARWAGAARVDDPVPVAGPIAGPELVSDTDWTLLVADLTAVAALAHRLEYVQAGRRVVAVVAVPDAAEERLLPTAATVDLRWVHGAGAEVLAELAAAVPDAGRGAAWLAGRPDLVDAVSPILATCPTLGGRVVTELFG